MIPQPCMACFIHGFFFPGMCARVVHIPWRKVMLTLKAITASQKYNGQNCSGNTRPSVFLRPARAQQRSDGKPFLREMPLIRVRLTRRCAPVVALFPLSTKMKYVAECNECSKRLYISAVFYTLPLPYTFIRTNTIIIKRENKH